MKRIYDEIVNIVNRDCSKGTIGKRHYVNSYIS